MKIQPSDDSCSRIWGQLQAEGLAMRWLLAGHGYLCSEENLQRGHRQTNLILYTSLIRVGLACHRFILTTLSFENAEYIKYPKPDQNNTYKQFLEIPQAYRKEMQASQKDPIGYRQGEEGMMHDVGVFLFQRERNLQLGPDISRIRCIPR